MKPSDRNFRATSKGRKSKEIEKKQKRERKAAFFGGAVRDTVPEDELSGGWTAGACGIARPRA